LTHEIAIRLKSKALLISTPFWHALVAALNGECSSCAFP
jgi:hypothetical protein